MKKVYVVTSGEYSSYQIRAVFSSKKLAEEYGEKILSISPSGRDDTEIEEWDLDLPKEEWVETDVCMGKDGVVLRVRRSMASSFSPRPQFDGDGNLYSCVTTSDEERAIKVTNERRTQILALGLWGDSKAVKSLFGGSNDQG